MTGRLVYDSVDPNDRAVVESILRAAMLQLAVSTNWFDLEVDATYHFKTPAAQLPSTAGWYIVIDARRAPLYVGVSENLDSRLNSRNGSRDHFGNPKRQNDSARNYLKRFLSTGILEGLRVGIVDEAAVLHELKLAGPLSKRDRCNVEKLLGIFRVGIVPANTQMEPTRAGS